MSTSKSIVVFLFSIFILCSLGMLAFGSSQAVEYSGRPSEESVRKFNEGIYLCIPAMICGIIFFIWIIRAGWDIWTGKIK